MVRKPLFRIPLLNASNFIGIYRCACMPVILKQAARCEKLGGCACRPDLLLRQPARHGDTCAGWHGHNTSAQRAQGIPQSSQADHRVSGHAVPCSSRVCGWVCSSLILAIDMLCMRRSMVAMPLVAWAVITRPDIGHHAAAAATRLGTELAHRVPHKHRSAQQDIGIGTEPAQDSMLRKVRIYG